MIHTLEMPYNQGLYVQWKDLLKSTGLPYNTIIENTTESDLDFESYLSNQSNIDYINSLVKSSDTLIIDSSYIKRYNGQLLNENELLSFKEKLNSNNIIIIHPDTGYSCDSAYRKDGLKILTPTYGELWATKKVQQHYNFYVCNGGYQDLRWLAQVVFRRYPDMKRAKKFLSYNGVYKFQRSMIHKTLKDNDLLKDSFFSYNAYNIFDENCNQEKERDIDFNNFLSEVSHLTEYHSKLEIRNLKDWKEKILKDNYTEQEHKSLLEDLPIVLDYIPNLSNVDQYAFTLPYTSNSYIEIIGCTSLSNYDGQIYTSEKIFKPFMSYNIPLFIGQKGLLKTLKKLGFDLFDDVIDTSYDDIECNLERTIKATENIVRLGKLSIEEIHELYNQSREKLEHNNYIMRELYHKQVETFKNLLNNNL